MRTAAALFWGTLFGVGLEVSGMTNPAKVQAFLDVFGHWDATLACVMGAALAVSAAGYQVARRRGRTWLGGPLQIPTRREIDGRLLGGAALFGVGWGLVGLCPGPALANLARGSGEVVLFVASLLAGGGLHRLLTREPRARGSEATI